MPGLANMEFPQASASTRPSRHTTTLNHSDAVAAPQSTIKEEDASEDENEDGYRPRPQLPTSLVLQRDLGSLMKLMVEGVIDVDPEYQREVVWTADRMTGLINSLMENYYIPPIIFNKKPQLVGGATLPRETLVCVDGKQRLSSVLAFVKGMIPCHDHRGEKWWFCEAAGSKRKRTLSEQQKHQFYKKMFVSFEFKNLSPEQEEDLFARVQMGMQLNLAEKMRASTGPWQELGRLFVEDFPTVYSLMKDRARSKDFQITLSCFSQIVECMHPTNANGVPTLKTNHTHLPKLLSNKGAVDDGLKSHLASVWTTFKDLIEADSDTFTNGTKYLRGVQTFAPVEMVAVTVLISIHSETRNNRLLLGDIRAMRSAVRENFVDLRLNAPVWKWFWDYIEELESIRGAIDGSTVSRKTKQRTKTNAITTTTTPTTTTIGNNAIGSTAAAIAAAAAAPKKGRATARTKRPAITIAEETPVEIKHESTTPALSESRLLKRRRTGDSPSVEEPVSGEYLEVHTHMPPRNGTPSRWLYPELVTSPMPTHASRPSPQPVMQKSRSGEETITSAPPSDQTPVSSRTPSEIRRQRISELNSYQSSYQSSSASLNPTGGRLTHVSPEAQRQGAGVPTMTAPSRYESSGNTGPFSDDQEHLRYGGSPKASNPRPLSTQQAHQASASSTQKQYDGIIDLTSDVEQERQTLLSAFKTKPTIPKLLNESSKSKSQTMPADKKRASKVKEQSVSQELPNRQFNPYAKFKGT